MMLEPAAARRYAQAFVAFASAEASADAALQDLAEVAQLLRRQPLLARGPWSRVLLREPLARLLANPEVSVDEKRALLTRLLQGRVAPLALRLLHLLLWKGRLALLPLLLTEARQLLDRRQGVTRGVVRTVHPLAPDTVARLQQRLERRFGTRVVLTTARDPALLGGITVQLGHVILDGSLRCGLARLRERLATLAVA